MKRILNAFVLIGITVFSFCNLYAQEGSGVFGIIKDANTNQALPYASIGIKNHFIGTISNKTGEFYFQFPEEMKNDTLFVCFLGYESYAKKISEIEGKIEILLDPKTVELNEITVLPYSPTDYIKLAVLAANDNYAPIPFNVISYYNEDLTENGEFIHKKEAVFKSWCPAFSDTIKNQHKLVLHRRFDDLKDLEFGKQWIAKKETKQKRKAERRKKRGKDIEKKEKKPKQDTVKKNDADANNDGGKSISITASSDSTRLDLGGPETVLNFDFIKENDSFLDSTKFEDYEYSFGELAYLNDRKLQKIYFKSKGKIDHIRQKGEILVDIENFAITAIEFHGDFVIPFYVRPILFAYGLKIREPKLKGRTEFINYKGKYYPKQTHWDMGGKLTKRYWFKDNEHAEIEIEQTLVVNEIKTELPSQIEEDKRYTPKKKMEEQIHEEQGIDWKNINIIWQKQL